jgi:hypothetical protein
MEKILSVVLICFALWSCDKSKSIDNLVVFEFQLLDEDGEQATTFASGENFRFSFSIINNMDEDLFISEMYDMENFFEVFKICDSGEIISYGKPYSAIFCEYIGGYTINSNETFRLEIPWIPDPDLHLPILCGLKHDNIPLPVGYYQTSISSTFTLQKGGEDFLTTKLLINTPFQITP